METALQRVRSSGICDRERSLRSAGSRRYHRYPALYQLNYSTTAIDHQLHWSQPFITNNVGLIRLDRNRIDRGPRRAPVSDNLTSSSWWTRSRCGSSCCGYKARGRTWIWRYPLGPKMASSPRTRWVGGSLNVHLKQQIHRTKGNALLQYNTIQYPYKPNGIRKGYIC